MTRRHATAAAWMPGLWAVGFSLWLAGAAAAHCDSTHGPVIPEAQAALERGDVTPVLKWVRKDDETEIRTAFAQAIAVRAKGPEAKALADRYFLETLVRVHRAGEGAPYTGIKAEPVAPVIALADRALADGSPEALIQAIQSHMAEAVREKFKALVAARARKDDSIEAGRAFVAAYVAYVHYVENVHAAIEASGAHHGEEAPGSGW